MQKWRPLGFACGLGVFLLVIIDRRLSVLPWKHNGGDHTLVPAGLKHHLSLRQKIQPYSRVDVSRTAIPDDIKTLSSAITYNPGETNENGNLDEL